MINRICYTLLLIMTLAACGDGEDGLPPVRPVVDSAVAKGVSGHAVDAAVVNGLISVYSFVDGQKGAMIDSVTTDSSGAYEIPFSEPAQPLLIELSGGHYIEDASGVLVSLADGQVLRALVLYNQDDALSVMVTPLTHMAVALAEFKISEGVNVNDAITQSHTALKEVFNFDVITTASRNINDPATATSVVSSSYLYGFMLAGISSWTQWVSDQNNAATHTTYTSIGFSQIVYNDLFSDGLLDGRGYNNAGTALMDLAFGVVPITPDLYRYGLPQRMLVMAASGRNQTTLTVADLRSSVLEMTANNATIFGSTSGAVPTITLATRAAGAFFSGVGTFTVDFGGSVTLESVDFLIDGNFESQVQPYASLAQATIDTSVYADGSYQLTVSAIDVLGQTYDAGFPIVIDNALPSVSLPSSQITNQENAVLQGSYSDDGTGVASITVQGTVANLDEGVWLAGVSLMAGFNTIAITVTDYAGNVFSTDMSIILDTNAPTIDVVNYQGNARLSQGDEAYLPLKDINPIALYLETDRLTLQGVPISPNELTANNIPYFGFRISDTLGVVGSIASDIIARIQYEVNGEVKSPWKPLIYNINNDIYLIPLVTDNLLPADWPQTVPTDQHSLRIQVADPAGNVAETEFTFMAEFYVPEITIDSPAKVATSEFSTTVFSARENLYDGDEVDALEYRFTNSTDHAFYIEFSDPSAHRAVQNIDEMERVHLVDASTTSTEWQAAYVNVGAPCPGLTDEPDWQPVTTIYNFNGFTWIAETVPLPQVNNPASIETDNVVITSSWQDALDFDNISNTVFANGDPFGYSYTYDYILGPNPSQGFDAAVITNWEQPGGIQCNDVRYFQERTVDTYISTAGYPKNEFRTLSESQSFLTTDIILIDDSSGTEVAPYLGFTGVWYRVPAGSAVTAIKRVTPPALQLYNDLGVDIANIDDPAFSYAPLRLDQKISWEIDEALGITVVHDAGEASLFAMPTTTMDVAEGTIAYEISR